MKRSSISIWKHARSQFDDLPDCPDDLSEPQYAEILFGKACTVSLVFNFFLRGSFFTNTNPSQFCQRSLPSNIVIWTSRVRSCAKCLSQKHVFLCIFISSAYITLNSFPPQIYMTPYPRHLFDSISFKTWVKSSKHFLNLKLYMFYCAYC